MEKKNFRRGREFPLFPSKIFHFNIPEKKIPSLLSFLFFGPELIFSTENEKGEKKKLK
jgi:hypothetical protein